MRAHSNVCGDVFVTWVASISLPSALTQIVSFCMAWGSCAEQIAGTSGIGKYVPLCLICWWISKCSVWGTAMCAEARHGYTLVASCGGILRWHLVVAPCNGRGCCRGVLPFERSRQCLQTHVFSYIKIPLCGSHVCVSAVLGPLIRLCM